MDAIIRNGRIYAMVIPRAASPRATEFFTGDADLLQVGFIVRPAGEPILRHFHLEAPRTVNETWEFLLVKQGSTTVTLYDEQRDPFATRLLSEGDAILLMGAGHGFDVHEDLVLLEVKQGPYVGTHDKERF